MSDQNHSNNNNLHTKSSRMKEALEGKYDFSLKHLFEHASKISKQNLWSVVQATGLILIIVFVTATLFLKLYGVKLTTIDDINAILPQQSYLMDAAITIIIAPLVTGLNMMGVVHSRGVKTTFLDVFKYVSHTLILAFTALFLSLLYKLGLMLLIFPGFYISIATTFALPLIADKGLKPIMAIKLSVLMVNKYLAKMIVLYIIFFILMLICLFTLGLALIWIAPLYINLKGKLYVDLFDENEATTNISEQESIFNA